ncbi:MAG TPA: protein kinase, partial [Terriglobales bacterium]|nr:protein kinase [Terriglobales bacterium]
MVGSTIGHYRILNKIGEGGMGSVYRAHDEVLQRDVAVKFLTPTLADKLGRDRLLAEARIASSLSHPNICTIYEVGKTDVDFYVVMELIEGKPLNVLLASGGLLYETALRYGVQIADALAHAHLRGIVHRDLKSANVIVTPEGRAKVLDFGLAMSLRKERLDDVTRSVVDFGSGSELVGTLAYIAPEILQGEIASQQSDVWSLGALLYEIAAGKLPFTGRTGLEMGSAILHKTPDPLPEHFPPGFTSVVQRCLSRDMALRFQTASEVRAALEALQSSSIAGHREPSNHEADLRTVFFRGINHLAVKNGDIVLMVGTNKGLFLFRSSNDRKQWKMAGPYFHGGAIYASTYDNRAGRHRMWIAVTSFWGSYLHSSDDFGRTWTKPLEATVKFPQDAAASLKAIWQITPGRTDEPDVLYCGVDPAALFESRDGGDSWSLVRTLFDHPHRPRWRPGNGGLCLHTILPDPADKNRMTIAISAAGVYQTSDGGQSWYPRNRGIRVVFAPERNPEFGQCVHRIVLHPNRPERMFLQNHWGLYRSDDYGESWKDIGHGVPSDFGFCMLMHPHNPDWVYVIPVESDQFRCTPEGRLRVYRTRNAGGSWEALGKGLPQKDAYETILRAGLTSDSLNPAGIYFGTRSGKVYYSRDDGKSWQELIDGLPQITSIHAAVVNELSEVRRARKPGVPRPKPKGSPKRGKKLSKG